MFLKNSDIWKRRPVGRVWWDLVRRSEFLSGTSPHPDNCHNHYQVDKSYHLHCSVLTEYWNILDPDPHLVWSLPGVFDHRLLLADVWQAPTIGKCLAPKPTNLSFITLSYFKYLAAFGYLNFTSYGYWELWRAFDRTVPIYSRIVQH